MVCEHLEDYQVVQDFHPIGLFEVEGEGPGGRPRNRLGGERRYRENSLWRGGIHSRLDVDVEE